MHELTCSLFVCKLAVTNMATMRIFEVISEYISNKSDICTSVYLNGMFFARHENKTNKTGSCTRREVYVARKLASPEGVLLGTAFVFFCNQPIKKKSVTG